MSSPVEENILESYCSGIGANICCGGRSIGTSIGVDANPTAKAALVHADARALPFMDDCLDYVVSAHGLEHIQDGPLLVLREWLRCVKVGGRMSLVVPDGRNNELKSLEYNSLPGRMNPNGHCHIFTVPILHALFVQAGMEDIETVKLDRSTYWDSDVIFATGIKSNRYRVDPQRFSRLVHLYRTVKSIKIKSRLSHVVGDWFEKVNDKVWCPCEE